MKVSQAKPGMRVAMMPRNHPKATLETGACMYEGYILAVGNYRTALHGACGRVVVEDPWAASKSVVVIHQKEDNRTRFMTGFEPDPVGPDTEWVLSTIPASHAMPYEKWVQVRAERELAALEVQSYQERMNTLVAQRRELLTNSAAVQKYLIDMLKSGKIALRGKYYNDEFSLDPVDPSMHLLTGPILASHLTAKDRKEYDKMTVELIEVQAKLRCQR